MSSPLSRRLPERIGHRGAPREQKENTLPSFARALELGADAIELDVHATSDRVVVVHHDPVVRIGSPDARRMTEIAELSWAELARLELAPGVAIPALRDVLDLVAGRATAYVEIKGKNIEREVVETVRGHGAAVAIHSFDHLAVASVRRLAPEIPSGVLLEDSGADAIATLRSAGARDAWPHYSLIDATLVDRVHDAGCRVIAWTVNTSAEVSRLTDLGVDGICTDALDLLRRR